MSNEPITPDTSLADAKQWLQERIRKGGADCPCCGQLAKVYPRSINATMARWLFSAVKLAQSQSWVHVGEIIGDITGKPKVTNASGGDFTKLVHWGLIEAKPSATDPTKREAGYWRPTQRGIDFAYNRVAVEKYAEIYNGELLKLDGTKQIRIGDALGESFDLQELMATLPTATPEL
jgi:hypothetical protein